MAMLAEHDDDVVGGDPDRDTVDLAVSDTATGGVRANMCDHTDGAGYERLLGWAQHRHLVGGCERWKQPAASPQSRRRARRGR